MSNIIEMKRAEVLDPAIIESIVLAGDLSKLKPDQKVVYYNYRCQQAGLDPSAKPFDLLTLSGKQVLYANAGATQQLCNIHKLSTQITHRERVDDIYLVSCRVTGADGRISENQGAVSVGGLKGDALANAILKATTKAIRRSVLAHCGLGMLDETEVETIPGARVAPVVQVASESPPKLVEEPVQTSGIPLMLPGKEEPYAWYKDLQEFVDALLTMVDRIAQSQKFSGATKAMKIGELEKANHSWIANVRDENVGLYEVLSTGIASARRDCDNEEKK
jgi:hypothetical protein